MIRHAVPVSLRQWLRSRSRLSLLLVLSALLAGASTATAGELSGWRVVWTSDPATQADILWNTEEAGKSHTVYYDTEPRNGRADDYAHRVKCERNGAYTQASGRKSESLFYHLAKLKDLEPGTQYYFIMESDGKRSRELHFETGPADDRPFRLIYGGDSRTDAKARRSVNKMIADFTAKDPQILAFVHGGDYIAKGTALDQWDEWMRDHELTVTESGRILPIVPARGNHDRGPLFDEVFGFPDGDENYYAFDIGPECRLINLNTELSAAGDQREWLERELPEARARRWVIAQYHRPAWPAVKGPSEAFRHWVPLFEKYNVDLVCEADGHNIKRTPGIRDGKADPTGVVYIGEGGLGVPQRTPKTEERWFLQAPGKAGSGHHIHLLSISPEHLRIQVVLLEGREIFDDHSLTPRMQLQPVGR